MSQTVKPEALAFALASHLLAGESVRHSIYGRDVSPWKVVVSCLAVFAPGAFLIGRILHGAPRLFLAFVIPVVLAVPCAFILVRLIRDFILALTNERLILIEVHTPLFSMNLARQKSMVSWPLHDLPSVTGYIGRAASKIAIRDARISLHLRVSYLMQRGARLQSSLLLEALTTIESQARPEASRQFYKAAFDRLDALFRSRAKVVN